MYRYGPKYNRGTTKNMKKVNEDQVPVNATGSGVSGTDGDNSFSPRLLGVLKRVLERAIPEKKKKKNGRK